MIIERIKTYIIAIGAGILAIILSLFWGEAKGRSAEKKNQEIENLQAAQTQQHEAQKVYTDAQQASVEVSTPPAPDVEKRNDLDTTH